MKNFSTLALKACLYQNLFFVEPYTFYSIHVHALFTSFVPGLPFQKNIQQGNNEAGAQSQVQTDGQQRSPPSPEPPSEENKIPDAEKVSDPLSLLV